jgi:hypothetical protein
MHAVNVELSWQRDPHPQVLFACMLLAAASALPTPRRYALTPEHQAKYNGLSAAAKANADAELQRMGSYDTARTRIDNNGRLFIVEDAASAPASSGPPARRAPVPRALAYTPEGDNQDLLVS